MVWRGESIPPAFLCLTVGWFDAKIGFNHQQEGVCKMPIIKDYKSDKTTFYQKLTGSKDVLEIGWSELWDSMNDNHGGYTNNPTDLLKKLSNFPYLIAVVNEEKNGIIILLPTKEQMEEVNG